MGRSTLTLKRPRIVTITEAYRCIEAILAYLRRHESPLAAEDLEDAIQVLIADAEIH